MTTPSAPRPLASVVFLATVIGFTSMFPTVHAREATPSTAFPVDAVPVPSIQRSGGVPRLSSDGTGPAALAKAAGDTFWIYGGPGTLEGRFETANGAPDAQGWTGVDISDQPNFWQVSTFNAVTLGGNGAGNRAAWAGRAVDQVEGWVHAPGYGNDWNEILSWTSPPLDDTSVAQEVELDFYFHHDLEPGYDFFTVQYDSAGFAPRPGGYYTGGGASGFVFSTDGTDADLNGDFQAPGVRFSDVQQAPIVFTGNDYGGPDGDRIVILVNVTSDGAWSDEDGLWVTNAGAAQIDDVRVRWNDGTGAIQESFEDFEGPEPLVDGPWRRVKAPFAGDFSSVLPNLSDIDPCWENRSPVVNFLDRGQVIGNADSAADFPGIPTSTGGSFSPNWSYGTPQGHVLNYTGGVSKQPGDTVDGPVGLFNEFWSPPFAYDLPGPEDDDPAVAGLLLQSHQYEHMPLLNGLFWIWSVRARTTSEGWTDWRDRNFVFYGNSFWTRDQRRIEDLFPETDIELMQISLGVWDLAGLFGFPGTDSTPGFYFDDVAMARLRLDGPVLSARPVDLAFGGFAESGAIDASTLAGRDALDVRFDMARDIASWDETRIDPGDSVIVDVDALIPSTTLADLALVWVLDRNPVFDDVRTPPSRPEDRDVDTTSDPRRWTGETVGQISTTSSGAVVDGRWFFDLPDADFLYPGDVLRYHIRATDDAGNVSTLPRDVSGFPDGEGYPETWTVRALPSLQDAAGSHPRALVIDYAADGPDRQQLSLLLDQLGWARGVDYDFFRRSHTASLASDGIGGAGAHGASAEQLAGYRTLAFAHGGARVGMSDGSDTSYNDRSPDTGVVRAWLDLPGPRSVIHLGADVGGGLHELSYTAEVLGATVGGSDPVREDFILRRAALPVGPEFEIHGGCQLAPAPLDKQQLGGRLRGHAWLDAHGDGTVGHWFEESTTGAQVQAATVFREWTDLAGDRKVALVSGVRPGGSAGDAPHPGGLLASTVFHRDLLAWADGSLVFGTPTDAPSPLLPRLDVAPTPFNPRTTLSLVIPRSGRTSVVAYDLRGRRVRTLLDRDLDAGVEHRIAWDGRDDRGARLASGVYVLAAEAPEWSERRKVVLLE